MKRERQRITFYHGTSLASAKRIAASGFKETLYYEPALNRWACSGDGGCLGIGIYLTTSVPVALFFGEILLRAELADGTNIVNATQPADARVIRYLRKEFGHGITEGNPREVMPRNKRLTKLETIELLKYHYNHVDKLYWTRRRDNTNWGYKRSMKNAQHLRRLFFLRDLLKHYGVNGFGDPESDIGLVVFDGSRVILRELVGEIPLFQPIGEGIEFRESFQDADQVRFYFEKHGSADAKRLAERIAAGSCRGA